MSRRSNRASPFVLLTAAKAFSEPWVGSPTLNRAGLHPLRIALSDGALALRRLQTPVPDLGEDMETFKRDGVLVIPDFLPAHRFEALRDEVRAAIARANTEHPPPANDTRGFGDRISFPGGFDRFDGSTLNRFLDPSEELPLTNALCNDERLAKLSTAAAGTRHHPERFLIHEIVHGAEYDNPDIQKRLHKDTFHSTVKLWFTVEDVSSQDGPFHFVRGSHRMTLRRYAWEYRRSVRASAPGARGKGGAFRASPEELTEMGLPAPTAYPVAANTLLMADTRGFHKRGDAVVGSRRLAIHASLRPSPFSPVPPW